MVGLFVSVSVCFRTVSVRQFVRGAETGGWVVKGKHQRVVRGDCGWCSDTSDAPLLVMEDSMTAMLVA